MSGMSDDDAYERLFEALEDAQAAYEHKVRSSTIAYLTSSQFDDDGHAGIGEPMALANIHISQTTAWAPGLTFSNSSTN